MIVKTEYATVIDYRGRKYLRYKENFYKLNKKAYNTISKGMEHSYDEVSLPIYTTEDKVVYAILIACAIYLTFLIGRIILSIF